MTENDIVRTLLKFFAGLFPRTCPKCGLRFASLREYVLATQPLWPSIDYDMEMGQDTTSNPIGALVMATCSCGSTLALSSRSLPLVQAHAIRNWIRAEAERRGVEPAALIDHLRGVGRRLILSEAGGHPE
jgi:hypothetical protein